MKRRFWIAGGLVLVAAIVLGFVILRPSKGQDHSATVVEAINAVDAHPRPKDDWQAAAVDMVIYGGGRVRTGGASSARLELLEGIVRLSADSIFTVKDSTTQRGKLVTTLFLEEGRLWAQLTTEQPHEFVVETGAAVAAVRDTHFSVKVAAGETLVSVAEGEVELTAQEQSVTVTAGKQATVAPGQPPTSPEPMSDEERVLWSTEGQVPGLAPPTPTPVPTPTPAPLPRSSFDGTETEGWTALPPGSLENPGQNGNTGNEEDGYVWIGAPGDGVTSYFVAPSEYHGDWRGYAELRLDLWSSGGGYYASGYDMYGDIYLANGDMTAQRLLSDRPPSDWEAFVIPLRDDGGWTLAGGAASLEDVLENVTDLQIRAEYGVGADEAALDNVELVR